MTTCTFYPNQRNKNEVLIPVPGRNMFMMRQRTASHCGRYGIADMRYESVLLITLSALSSSSVLFWAAAALAILDKSNEESLDSMDLLEPRLDPSVFSSDCCERGLSRPSSPSRGVSDGLGLDPGTLRESVRVSCGLALPGGRTSLAFRVLHRDFPGAGGANPLFCPGGTKVFLVAGGASPPGAGGGAKVVFFGFTMISLLLQHYR